jgi:hypothetical protein
MSRLSSVKVGQRMTSYSSFHWYTAHSDPFTRNTDPKSDLLHHLCSMLSLRGQIRNWKTRQRHPNRRHSQSPLLLVALRAFLHCHNRLHPSLNRSLPPPHSSEAAPPRHHLWNTRDGHRFLPVLLLPRHVSMQSSQLLLGPV